MKKGERNLLIGAVVVGGYLWYTKKKASAAPAVAPTQGTSIFSGLATTIASIFSPGSPQTVTLSAPKVQNIKPHSTYDEAASEAAFDAMHGYYGSLGGVDKGSLGGGFRALRGGRYGSLQ